MADDFRVNTRDSPQTRLRTANNSLLRSLQEGQRGVWSLLNSMKAGKSTYGEDFSGDPRLETSFSYRTSLDRTPVSVRRTESRRVENGVTSTPKSYRDALRENGNDRRHNTASEVGRTSSSSILLTPGNRARKTPKKGLCVSFQTSPDYSRNIVGDDLNRRSLLGYDWIAGILDNTSYLAEQPDNFFDDLKEFRRVNKGDCYSRTFSEAPVTPYKTTRVKKDNDFEEEKESYSCANTYRLNERLFAEPVHAPDVSCSVCKTRPEPEYETEGSYVRVSVPRSTLLSPYKVKPHRRVSFDPTDSVGLSSHCLAGWETSKPAVVQPPSSLDLKASLHQSRVTLDASRAGRYSPPTHSTRDLLDRSHLMRYGLQVLDRDRGLSTRPHTTPYPAF